MALFSVVFAVMFLCMVSCWTDPHSPLNEDSEKDSPLNESSDEKIKKESKTITPMSSSIFDSLIEFLTNHFIAHLTWLTLILIAPYFRHDDRQELQRKIEILEKTIKELKNDMNECEICKNNKDNINEEEEEKANRFPVANAAETIGAVNDGAQADDGNKTAVESDFTIADIKQKSKDANVAAKNIQHGGEVVVNKGIQETGDYSNGITNFDQVDYGFPSSS